MGSNLKIQVIEVPLEGLFPANDPFVRRFCRQRIPTRTGEMSRQSFGHGDAVAGFDTRSFVEVERSQAGSESGGKSRPFYQKGVSNIRNENYLD